MGAANKNIPKTLQQAILFYADPENCREFMTELRWPDGKVTCPNCGSDNVKWLPNARLFKCFEKHPRQKFSLKVGTIFEDSPIGLEKWLPAMWLLVNCKNGVSSWELHRAIGVTQKTAWFMLQRLRLALQGEDGGTLGGEVEMDETFIGGKARNMHAKKRKEKIHGTGGTDKEIVFGMVERGGKVRASHVVTRGKDELQKIIREQVEVGAAIFTDELKSYEGLTEYEHSVINHAIEYVNGNVHTNTMENFWSLLKRGLHGTYVSVEPFHLFRYIDEQAFRYNNRTDMNDSDRFVTAMTQVVGKRLTYAELTGKVEGAPASMAQGVSAEESDLGSFEPF
jgi:transposase-like protein